MPTPLVPTDFAVPTVHRTEQFLFEPLSIHHVVKDYDAVMTSVDHLQGTFGERSSWPSPELTLEQNLIDLGWHHKEFQRRTSFAYSVLSADGERYLGCVYMYPSDDGESDVEAYAWLRTSAYDAGLDPVLFAQFRQWLDEAWPFQAVSYPGRTP